MECGLEEHGDTKQNDKYKGATHQQRHWKRQQLTGWWASRRTCKKDNVQTTHGWDSCFMAQWMPSSAAHNLPSLFSEDFYHHLTGNIHSVKKNNYFYSICILSLKHSIPINLSMGMKKTSSLMRRRHSCLKHCLGLVGRSYRNFTSLDLLWEGSAWIPGGLHRWVLRWFSTRYNSVLFQDLSICELKQTVGHLEGRWLRSSDIHTLPWFIKVKILFTQFVWGKALITYFFWFI